MSSPANQMLFEMLRGIPRGAARDPLRARAEFVRLTSLFTVPADVRRERVDAGGVPAEWFVAPGADAGRVLLYLHGGAYVMGSPDTHRELIARLARATGARVLAADYRLAPEHACPAAVHDAAAAYRWLLAGGARPERIVIGGDSAGGGLTVAALVALRDAGTPLPAGGVCLSPWVDLEGIGASMAGNVETDPIVERASLQRMAAAYLGGADPRTPLAAPLYADLRSLPPLLVHVSAAEALYDDAVRLAERARAAGVEVALEPWDGMVHVWHMFASLLPEGAEAIARVGAWVRGRMAG